MMLSIVKLTSDFARYGAAQFEPGDACRVGSRRLWVAKISSACQQGLSRFSSQSCLHLAVAAVAAACCILLLVLVF